MLKFKRGDRVRALKDEYGLKAGEIRTVRAAVSNTLKLSNGYTYWVDRGGFELVNTPRLFQVGDTVKCIDPCGYEAYGFEAGKLMKVTNVHPCRSHGVPQWLFFEELRGRGGAFSTRFQLVEPTQGEFDNWAKRPVKMAAKRDPRPRRPARAFKPHIGSLDQYGPETVAAPVNPLFTAIGRRWPTHPSDALIQLDELARDR